MKEIKAYAAPIAALTAGVAAFGFAVAVAFAPDAKAQGQCNPYNTQASGGAIVFGAGGYWCDEFPIPGTDVHKHCEWGGFIGYGGGCTWRNSANQIVPPPAVRP